MTKTVKGNLQREIIDLRKDVERLTAALAAVKNRKGAYLLEIRTGDGEKFTTERTYYYLKKDAVNDLMVARAKFAGDNKELLKTEPCHVNRGTMELTMATEDGTFRGEISRIKII